MLALDGAVALGGEELLRAVLQEVLPLLPHAAGQRTSAGLREILGLEHDLETLPELSPDPLRCPAMHLCCQSRTTARRAGSGLNCAMANMYDVEETR